MDLLLYMAKDFIQVLLPPLLNYVQEASKPGACWQQKESAYYIIGAISEGIDDDVMAKFNIEGIFIHMLGSHCYIPTHIYEL